MMYDPKKQLESEPAELIEESTPVWLLVATAITLASLVIWSAL